MSEAAATNEVGPVVLDRLEGPLAALRFENRFVAELPADPIEGPGPRQVPGAAYSKVNPANTSGPQIVAWSSEVSDQLGLNDEVWSSVEAAQVFTGNALLPGSEPHAANYAGHQFGNWAGQLGDGRAIALGEVIDIDGAHQTLQLKGAGPTPYSRGADGLAVVRSSVREFLCSEAMHHLGVPTTRALSLALTGDQVLRDMFYDGNAAMEPGAVVCRVAPSFLRFGSYQLFASRGEIEQLQALTDFTIRHYAPWLLPASGAPTPETYAAWFDEVCQMSCDMVLQWMRVGFVHGVMNTDNMSIHGLTIDYGPYGWLDDFDQNWTPNTTDAGAKRYRYGHQPQITQWNLLQLANAIVPLATDVEALEASLNGFVDRYKAGYRKMMLAKMGLAPIEASAAGVDEADALIVDLTDLLQSHETDMTIFFRRLASLPAKPEVDSTAFEGQELARWAFDPNGMGQAFYQLDTMANDATRRVVEWLGRYGNRLLVERVDSGIRAEAMNNVNPKYVLRNYLAQLAIDDAEQGDFAKINKLAAVLRHPYDEQPEADAYAAKRPDWARSRPGCSMLSCSS